MSSLVVYMFPMALLFCIAGFILGTVSLVRIRKSDGRLAGVGRARVAVFVGLIGIAVVLLAVMSVRVHSNAERMRFSVHEAIDVPPAS